MSARSTAGLALCVGLCGLPGLVGAEDRVSLSLRDVARPVAVSPGGEVVVRGVVHSTHDGTVVDALTTTTGEGAGVTTVPGGLYDIEAGGWRLVSRDPRAHAYRIAATGTPGSGCTEASVASPCLPLRLLPLAQSRLLSVSEFAASLTGAMTLEVVNPDADPPAGPGEPGLVGRVAAPVAGALALAVAAWAGARGLRRRAARPEMRVRRLGARVRARLVAGDLVHRTLVPAVDRLVARALELCALRERLEERVSAMGRAAMVVRRAELAGRGDAETTAARTLVDEQLARIDAWAEEARRAGGRVDRILEYLRTLEQRLTDPAPASDSGDADARLLADVEGDVQSALDAVREADRLVAGRTGA